jgi:uncharacterized protein (DUF488 family)
LLDTSEAEPARTLYTIGHSNQSAEAFIALLRGHGIEVVVDVRTVPYSRWAPQFSQRELRTTITDAGLRYLYLGTELGGRPATPDLYDADGHARYDLMAQTEAFRHGIERVQQGNGSYRVALMCSEEDPAGCHRRLLVGRVLVNDGVRLLHIRGDGALEPEDPAALAFRESYQQPSLLPGVAAKAPEVWRSARPIFGRDARTGDDAPE